MIEMTLVPVLPVGEDQHNHLLLVPQGALPAGTRQVGLALVQQYWVLLHPALQGGHHQVMASVYAYVLYTPKDE